MPKYGIYVETIRKLDPTNSVNAVGVECAMRLLYGTLDHLATDRFVYEIGIAKLDEEMNPGELRLCADSYGRVEEFDRYEKEYLSDETRQFCPISLLEWLEVSARADVPAVEGKAISSVRTRDFEYWDQIGSPEQVRLNEGLVQACELAEKNTMVRYDCCSGDAIKIGLSRGEWKWQQEYAYPEVDSDRLLTIIGDFPREELAIVQRPWVPQMIVENYPVEYRVFVRDGEVVGISNYYPQRELPRYDEHLALVRRYTDALIAELQGPFLWHSGMVFAMGKDKLDLDGIHFTVDYIVDENGEVLFLEGGPPAELGAHPCCFAGDEIEGVALKDRAAPRDVSDIQALFDSLGQG